MSSALYCPASISVFNGGASCASTAVGSACVVKCNSGYNGNAATFLCDTSGSWSGSINCNRRFHIFMILMVSYVLQRIFAMTQQRASFPPIVLLKPVNALEFIRQAHAASSAMLATQELRTTPAAQLATGLEILFVNLAHPANSSLFKDSRHATRGQPALSDLHTRPKPPLLHLISFVLPFQDHVLPISTSQKHRH